MWFEKHVYRVGKSWLPPLYILYIGVCAGRARTENHCEAGENSADAKRCQPVTIYTSIILGVGLVNPVKDYMIDSTVDV